MAEWSLPDLDSPINQFDYIFAPGPPCNQGENMPKPPVPTVPPAPPMPPPPPPPPRRRPRVPKCPPSLQPQAQPSTSQQSNIALDLQHYGNSSVVPQPDNPRTIRNKAEKMRRDRLNQSIAELAAIVPPVLAARRKVDKTSVLRLTAHYLRCYDHVFGDSIGWTAKQFSQTSVMKILNLFNGFLITTTYRGIIVVVSENVNEYLGYEEADLLGHNLLNFTYERDRAMLKYQLMPRHQNLGPSGELLIPDEPGAKSQVEEALAREKRSFFIRIKKFGQRSEPAQYVTCHFEGSLRRSDKAYGALNKCRQLVRRCRARTENPYNSGNDIVFIGMVRPTCETFINESAMEGYRMEYRTRHSIDGQIIQSEARIAMVTGYMTHEVSGANAMNFMHKDDVKWVVIALREMYDTHKVYGESCYRLRTKNGRFIYMRTRGRLDVDKYTGTCTSFVCNNTMVGEKEGKHLIKMMRKKFTIIVNNQTYPAVQDIDEEIRDEEKDGLQVDREIENPRRLEEVILHLVTDLPSSPKRSLTDNTKTSTPERSMSPVQRINIIPPDRAKIISAIDKIYDVIKSLNRDKDLRRLEEIGGFERRNRRGIYSIFEKHKPVPSTSRTCTSQESRVIELGPNSSNDPNEIFNFGLDSIESSTNPNEIMCNVFENNLNCGSVVDSTLSSDLGYFDNSLGENSGISSIYGNFNQYIVDTNCNYQTEYQPTFHITEPQMNFFPLARLPEESNCSHMFPEPSTSNSMGGIKRPIDFEEEGVTIKNKKITELTRQSEPISGFESPTLEDLLLDETLFNNQIESETDLLDSIEPTIPDLLESAEVQDILGQLEIEQQGDEQPDLE